MTAEAKVNWYEDKVRLVIDEKTGQTLLNAAFRIEERTKVNINQAPGASGQGLIDTSFMLNSTYVVGPKVSTYDQALRSGMYTNRAGEEVERNLAPQADLPRDAAALVAVGAEYAVFQEIIHHFFFQAIEDTSRELGGLIEKF
jgi:hypothetical protein